ncbi:MAG TPA: helix-turn-helix domain-containing protein [Rhodanobacteraceae bacterium]
MLATHDRIDASSRWQRSLADCCVSCRIQAPRAFRGEVSSASAGSLRYNRVRATCHRASRVAVDDRNTAVLLNRVLSGRVRVRQDGREAVLCAGDFAIHTAARPYGLTFETPFSELIFQIPRRLFEQRVGRFDRLTAVAVSGADPLGRLAANFLVDVARTAPRLDAVMAERVSLQALDLVAAALCASPLCNRAGRGSSAHRAALLCRIKAYVETHLGESLNAGDVGSAVLGCSARYVHSLFADEATCFGDYVLARRLERCAEELACGQPNRGIGELAFAWGFNSASHFCRSFGHRFGVSPTHYRAQCRGPGARAGTARLDAPAGFPASACL